MKARRRRTKSSGRRLSKEVHYKVVELSVVDESSLERTLNVWVGAGWTLDTVQFAMRESSRRPAMAFVVFTKEGAPPKEDADDAWRKLSRLAGERPMVSAKERLAELAEEPNE
jgi:hypothetical protein